MKEQPGLCDHSYHLISYHCYAAASARLTVGTDFMEPGFTPENGTTKPPRGAILYLQTFFAFILRVIAERCWILLLSLNTQSPVSQDHAVPPFTAAM